MSLVHLLIGSATAFATLSWCLIPVTKRRLTHDRSAASILRAALLSLFGVLRMTSLVLMLTTAACAGGIWALGQIGGLSVSALGSAVEIARTIREQLSWFSGFWSGVALLLIGGGLALHSWRRGKLRFAQAFDRKHNQELERLKQEFASDQWEDLPPNAAMTAIDGEFEQLQNLANQIVTSLPEEQGLPLLEQVKARAAVLNELRFIADINRRVDMRLDPEVVELPPPTTRWQKLERFFFSEGLVASLGRTSRLLYLAALIMLIPSLIGIYAGTMRQDLDDRIVQLDDVRLDLSAKDAAADWDAAKQGLAQGAATADEVAELSEEEEEAIDAMAFVAEIRFARSLLGGQFELQQSQLAPLQAMSVRQRILRTAAEHAVSGVEVSPDLEKSPHLDAAQREAIHQIEDANIRKPRTSFGEAISREAKDLASRSPGFRERLRTGLASFQRPARSQTMALAMTRHATGLILDGGDGELGRMIEQSLDGANARKTAGALSDIRSRQFLQEVAGGKPIGDSLDNLSKSAPFASTRQMAELQAIQQRAGSWPEPNQILERLENHPPGIDSLPERHTRLSEAGARVDNLVQHLTPAGQRARGAQLADSVAQYRDWFPSYSGADRASIRGQLLAAWESNTSLQAQLEHVSSTHGPLPESITGIDPNRPPVEVVSGSGDGGDGGSGGGGGGGNITKTPPKSPNPGTGSPRLSPPRTPQVRNVSFASSSSGASTRSSFLRARSFRGLRGFARVGGVLIGNEPDGNPSQLDVRDLTWTLDDSGLILITRDAEGREHRSRSFRTSVARQALEYAADGRPLAVTMVTATPLSELRILLHPALIDTPLGARVIEIDRFVDVFTQSEDSKHDFRGDASAFVIHSTRLYEFAWALRLTSAHGDILSLAEIRLKPESHAVVRSNLEGAAKIVDDPQFLRSAAVAMLQLDGLKDPNRTPLKAKPEFYDQGLVDAIISVAEEANGDLSKFIPLFSERFKNALQRSRSPLAGRNLGNLNFEGLNGGQFDASDAIVDKMIDWLKPAPTFEIWSGVREKKFRSTLDELLPVSSESTLPLNFMLQVAFTSFPAYLDGASEDEEYTDDNPWEFPSIADAVHRTVIEESRNDERSEEILKDVAEFTLLQRFFRAAFDGQLGEDFPIEKLGELQDVCLQKAPQRYWRTLRWNSRDGSLEATFIAQLKNLDEAPQTKEMLERLEQNIAIRVKRDEGVAKLLEDRSADEAPDAEWTKRWDKLWEDANSQLIAWEDAWVRDYDGADAVAPNAESAVTWFTNVVQIRRALGVSVDDAQSRMDSRIPIPPL